jgi:diamine N-acetyltransferase
MSGIKIRIATEKDAELLADLSRKTFYDAYAGDNSTADMDKFMSEIFTKERLMEEPSMHGNFFFLAYSNDEVAGYVRIRDKNPDGESNYSAFEIARLYAVQQMIGKGIGSSLMQTCIDLAKEKNKKFLWLAVWKKNQRAIDFYEKWGFKKFGEQDFPLGNDLQSDWLMKKEL